MKFPSIKNGAEGVPLQVYRQPLYYEVAFSFIDPKKQVNNFERLIRKFSGIKVKTFLDIACGPSLQLREIARRGYGAIGLDSSREMLGYLRGKAQEEHLDITTVQADMFSFKLRKKADFAFIMMGSLRPDSNDKFLSHLDSVAASLNQGGLYLIQNMGLDWTRKANQKWTVKKRGITVRTSFDFRLKDIIGQIYGERLMLDVDDNGRKRVFVSERDMKFIFPQEFKALLKLNGEFEFLGWWKGNCNTWHLNQPLEKVKDLADNMVLIRKK